MTDYAPHPNVAMFHVACFDAVHTSNYSTGIRESVALLLNHESGPVEVIPKNYSPVESVEVLGLPQGLGHSVSQNACRILAATSVWTSDQMPLPENRRKSVSPKCRYYMKNKTLSKS